MKKLEKLAEEFSSDLYKEMCKISPEIAGKPDPFMDHFMERAFTFGFLKARELAAEKILASVDLKSIEDAGLLDDASINCGLQAKHDHDICMSLGEEEVE